MTIKQFISLFIIPEQQWDYLHHKIIERKIPSMIWDGKPQFFDISPVYAPADRILWKK